jgi:serine-type D-Ala-D-Ala endopeptidase (penicillin-binding protein 7)
MKKYGPTSYVLSVLCVGLLGWVGTAALLYGSQNLLQATARASAYKGVYESADPLATVSDKSLGTYYLSALAPAPPELEARGYIVADLLSGSVIIESNSAKSYPIASLSKVMTALVATELGPSESVAEMFYPLLLESNNEIAEDIAKSFGRQDFMHAMNEIAAKIGMHDTHYNDASGLSQYNVSSAADLLKLVQYLYKNHPEIISLTRVSEKALVTTDKYRMWRNNNQFVQQRHPDYIGGKSGYTPEAGGTLISLFALPIAGDELRPMAVILLGTKTSKGIKYEVAESIIDYITENVYYK